LAWFEQALFGITGAAMKRGSTPAAKLLLDSASHRHAWRAQQLTARLPSIGDVEPVAYVVAGSPALLGLVDDLSGDADELVVLVGIYGVVVPDLIAAYRYHRGMVDGRTDPSTARVLDVVLNDALEDWLAGRVLAETRILAEPRRAAEVTGRLTARLAEAGGCAGTCTFAPPAQRRDVQ
jgi:hypothetical protein